MSSLTPFQLISLAALGGLIVISLLAFAYKKPDAMTNAVFFLIYSNVAVIAKRFHGGVASALSLAFCCMLIFPLMHHLIVKREKIIIDQPFFLMLGYLTVLLTSSLFVAKNLRLALDGVFGFLFEGLLLYFLIVNVVRNIQAFKHVIWILLFTGSLLGTLTLYQEVTHSYSTTFGGLAQRTYDEKDERTYNRAGGPVGEKNRFAQLMAVLMPLGLFRFWSEKTRFWKMIALANTALILIGVILTYSRGAFLSIIVLVIITFLMRYITVRQLAIIAVGFIGVTIFVAPQFFERMNSIFTVKSVVSDDSEEEADGATRGRITETLASLHVFLDHPILGVGPSQYMKMYSVDYMNNAEIAFRRIKIPRRAHCLYTELAAEAGVLGFTLFMAIVCTIMYKLWELERYFGDKNSELSMVAASLLLSVLCYLICAVFLHLAYQRYYWILLGVAGAGIQILSSERDNSMSLT